MAPSDSEGDDDDRTTDADGEDGQDIDDDGDAVEADAVAEDLTDGDENSDSDSFEDSEEGGDLDDDSDPSGEFTQEQVAGGEDRPPTNSQQSLTSGGTLESTRSPLQLSEASSHTKRTRTPSPAQKRKHEIIPSQRNVPRSYTVEAICALPHPVPTHSLASSLCVTHLLTGSDDGYIRDYDIFSAVNGKVFLSAQQRHHSGVVEGIMKSGQLRCWWENPIANCRALDNDESGLAPVYSMAMHSDALWMLAGNNSGTINLFTVRHEPGRLCHAMTGHRGPVSALCMTHDEKGFFSAGWDGDALQWDLNTGQVVQKYTSHGAQLAAVALKPMSLAFAWNPAPVAYHSRSKTESKTTQITSTTLSDTDQNTSSTIGTSTAAPSQQQTETSGPRAQQDFDAKSDTSFDPLFDDEDETHGDFHERLHSNTNHQRSKANAQSQQQVSAQSLAPPKNAPHLLDAAAYSAFSPDIILTASIDGQVILWDKRCQGLKEKGGVGRLWMSEKTPPWCLSACWSADGGQIFAGRRNGTIDVWDLRHLGVSGPCATPRLLKTLRNPVSSGVVSCVVAFPDGKHIACASIDNIRLWNAAEAGEPDGSGRMKSGVQFKIIPGHHGGYISQMLVDPAARFLVSASSNRGWHGDSTKTVFVHNIVRKN